MSKLSGDWLVELNFVRGEARHAMRLEQEGEALKGCYRSLFGTHEVRGRRQGEVVEMQVGINYQGVGTTYLFQGTLQGDSMQGEVDLGEYWKATWKAQRVD